MASKDHTKNGRDNMGNTNTNTNQDSTKENNTNNEKSSEGSAKLNPDRPHRDNTRIPGIVQIGMPTTVGAVMTNTAGPFQPQSSLENPTVSELYDFARAHMEGSGSNGAAIIRLPNNGFPLGTCAGCGGAEGLQVCGKCKERKYCGRKCQKNDWKWHKETCGKAAEAGEKEKAGDGAQN